MSSQDSPESSPESESESSESFEPPLSPTRSSKKAWTWFLSTVTTDSPASPVPSMLVTGMVSKVTLPPARFCIWVARPITSHPSLSTTELSMAERRSLNFEGLVRVEVLSTLLAKLAM